MALGRQEEERGLNSLAVHCCQRLPSIYTAGMARVFYTCPSTRASTGVEGGGEEEGREVETPRVVFKIPWPSVNSSSQAAGFRESQRQWQSGRERGREEQGREGHQAAATWEMRPHLGSVFWKRKIPPKPHPAPATVCLTQSSRTLKELKSSSSSFWGTEGG